MRFTPSIFNERIAFFGDPVPHPDDPSLALDAAVADVVKPMPPRDNARTHSATKAVIPPRRAGLPAPPFNSAAPSGALLSLYATRLPKLNQYATALPIR